MFDGNTINNSIEISEYNFILNEEQFLMKREVHKPKQCDFNVQSICQKNGESLIVLQEL